MSHFAGRDDPEIANNFHGTRGSRKKVKRREKERKRERGQGRQTKIAKRRTKKSRCLVGVGSRLLITILDVVMPGSPLYVAKAKRSRFGVVSKDTGIRHNGEKPTLYIEPIEVTVRARRSVRAVRRKGWRDGGGAPLKENPRIARSREETAGPRLAPSYIYIYTYIQSPSADTDRLPPQGNYEPRPGLVGPSRDEWQKAAS